MGRFTAVLTVAGIALGCGRVGFDARSDGGETVDGSPDAPELPFCDPHAGATLCSDFANGSAGWSNEETQNGSYAIDPAGGPTPSSGALVITTNVGGGPAEVNLIVGHAPPMTSLTYSFDVKIDVEGAGLPALGLAVFDGAGTSHGIEYVYGTNAGDPNLEEIIDPDVGAPTFVNTFVPGFPPNEWHRVSVDIAIGTPWTATVKIDGMQSTLVTLSDSTNGVVSFSVGVPYLADTSLPWVMRFSNVLLDMQ